MKLVTIIVTYNSAMWIKTCLDSLAKSTLSTHVIIVDNNSQDGSLPIIRQHELKSEILELNTNEGFGKANNIALREAYIAGYEYFFLLNHDAWIVGENTLEKIIQIQSTHPQFGIVSPIHLEKTQKSMDRHFEHYISGISSINKNFSLSEKPILYEVDFVNAAGWMISRHCLEEVGLFHPLFDHYGEDVNFALRAQFAGFKLGVIDNLYMVHDRNYENRKAAISDGKRKFERRMLQFLLNPGTHLTSKSLWIETFMQFTKLISSYGFFRSLSLLNWSISKTLKLRKDVDSFDSEKLDLKY